MSAGAGVDCTRGAAHRRHAKRVLQITLGTLLGVEGACRVWLGIVETEGAEADNCRCKFEVEEGCQPVTCALWVAVAEVNAQFLTWNTTVASNRVMRLSGAPWPAEYTATTTTSPTPYLKLCLLLLVYSDKAEFKGLMD